MPRLPVLVSIAMVSAVCLAVVYWPSTERIPGERLEAAQIIAQSDAGVVAKVTARLSQRAGSTLSGWRRLPEACRPVYVVGAFVAACDKYSLADQANANSMFPDAPTFAETTDALRAVGAVAVATVLTEAATVARSQAEAMQAWLAFRSKTDPGAKAPPDPLAACEARLRTALAAARLEDALAKYIRAHTVELADP